MFDWTRKIRDPICDCPPAWDEQDKRESWIENRADEIAKEISETPLYLAQIMNEAGDQALLPLATALCSSIENRVANWDRQHVMDIRIATKAFIETEAYRLAGEEYE